MSRILISFLVSVTFSLSLTLQGAIDPPSLRCVAVNADGTISLSWDTPAGIPSQFINYTIFSSANSIGPYLIIDSVTTFNQQTYLDPGSVGNIYYFISTKYQDSTGVTYSSPSDTLKNIVLTVSSLSGNSLPPQLSWTPLHVPNLITNSGKYRIYRKKGFAGTWALIDSTNYGNEKYSDLGIVVCSDSLYYKVETDDNLPCISISTIDSELFKEETPPNVLILDSVSLDTSTGTAKIGWQLSSSPDVTGYIIYYNNNGTWITDTIWSDSTTYFEKLNVQGNYYILDFNIAAIDSCGNVSNILTSNKHSTMFLTGAENLCNREMILSWTKYAGYVVSTYDIFSSQDGTSFKWVGSVDGTENTFSHLGLNNLSSYCYTVVANGNNKTSRSNNACLQFTQSNLPVFHFEVYATVTPDHLVKVRCLVDTTAEVDRYVLTRSFKKDGPYLDVDVLFNPDSLEILFIDSTVRPDQSAYYYRVDAMDSCDQIIVRSGVHRTIHLSVFDDAPNFFHNLTWNFYEGWDSLGFGVQSYRIYSAFNEDYSIATDSVGRLKNDFIDLYYDSKNAGGNFCFFIEAQETGNIYNYRSISQSNRVCLQKEAVVYIPVIFTPNRDGLNDVFMPEIQFVDANDFQMCIYDRWGKQVLIVENPAEGWDGSYNGSDAPSGAYVYHLKYRNSKGSFFEKLGSITLYR